MLWLASDSTCQLLSIRLNLVAVRREGIKQFRPKLYGGELPAALPGKVGDHLEIELWFDHDEPPPAPCCQFPLNNGHQPVADGRRGSCHVLQQSSKCLKAGLLLGISSGPDPCHRHVDNPSNGSWLGDGLVLVGGRVKRHRFLES